MTAYGPHRAPAGAALLMLAVLSVPAIANQPFSPGALSEHFAVALDCGPGECAEISPADPEDSRNDDMRQRRERPEQSGSEVPSVRLPAPSSGQGVAPDADDVLRPPAASAPAQVEARVEAQVEADSPPPPATSAPPTASAGPAIGAVAAASVVLPPTPGFDLQISFDAGSSRLQPDSQVNLKTTAEALLDGDLANARFLIAAHTSGRGGARDMSLSRVRALVVKSALQAYGVPGDRLVATGFGATQPLAGSDPQSPEQERIELHLLR
ncbi:MAG: OmpA family protein [Pseudomonadota bacterium]